MVKHYFLTLI